MLTAPDPTRRPKGSGVRPPPFSGRDEGGRSDSAARRLGGEWDRSRRAGPQVVPSARTLRAPLPNSSRCTSFDQKTRRRPHRPAPVAPLAEMRESLGTRSDFGTRVDSSGSEAEAAWPATRAERRATGRQRRRGHISRAPIWRSCPVDEVRRSVPPAIGSRRSTGATAGSAAGRPSVLRGAD